MALLKLVVLLGVATTLVEWCQAQGRCGCTPRFRRDAHLKLLKETEKGDVVTDGDMILTKHDAMVFAGFRASEDPSRQWPKGEVFYEVSRMPGNDQNMIRQALNALSQATGGCVRFTETRGGGSGAYVSVFPGGGCYSMIGKMGNRQDLSLGNGCMYTHTIQHEFMHALGFYHEQSRNDRDQFVQVHWNRIDSNMCGNFQRCAGCKLTTPYDMTSIMQYPGEAFSCNGGRAGDTMVGKNGQKIGWNKQLTQNDVKKIKDYYQCNRG
jgi:hypothetical protein